MLFAVTYRAGFRTIVLDEIGERLGDVSVERSLAGRRYDMTLFECEGELSRLLGLRSAEGVFAVCTHFDGIKVAREGAERLVAACTSATLANALAAVSGARGEAMPEPPGFVLTVNLVGKHKFDQRDVRPPLLRWLEQDMGWELRPDEHDVNVRVQLMRDKGILGLSLPKGPLGKRPYKVATRPGSLPPSLAYCLARLTRPEPGDVYVDPLCGAGTVAIERGLGWPAGATIIGGDVDARAVSMAAANARAAAVQVAAVRWDATRLPLADASVSKMAMNMPYGKDTSFAANDEETIERVLHEAARVTRSGGRVVVLSAHRRLARRLAKRGRKFRLDDEMPVSLDGFKLTLLVLRRR